MLDMTGFHPREVIAYAERIRFNPDELFAN